MHKHLHLFILLLCLPLTLCGCSHSYLERQVYPLCISIDLTADGQFRVGLQAPQSGSSANAAYDVLSATGETPTDALRVLAASIPYPLNFSQIRLCLIDYELAAAQPLRPLLRTLFELPTMRPNAYVMAALGDAYDVMQAQKPDFGMRMSTHLNLLFERLRQEQTLPDSTLSSCIRELSDGRSDLLLCICAVNAQLEQQNQSHSGGGDTGGAGSGGASAAFSIGETWSDQLLPEGVMAGMLPRTSQNPVEYLGAATVSDGRVSGTLTAEETQLAVRILNEAELRVAIEGERLQLQILLPRDGQLRHSKNRIEALMQKLQALRCDPMTFGCLASMQFRTDMEWQGYDFRSRYPRAEVAVAVQ